MKKIWFSFYMKNICWTINRAKEKKSFPSPSAGAANVCFNKMNRNEPHFPFNYIFSPSLLVVTINCRKVWHSFLSQTLQTLRMIGWSDDDDLNICSMSIQLMFEWFVLIYNRKNDVVTMDLNLQNVNGHKWWKRLASDSFDWWWVGGKHFVLLVSLGRVGLGWPFSFSSSFAYRWP